MKSKLIKIFVSMILIIGAGAIIISLMNSKGDKEVKRMIRSFRL